MSSLPRTRPLWRISSSRYVAICARFFFGLAIFCFFSPFSNFLHSECSSQVLKREPLPPSTRVSHADIAPVDLQKVRTMSPTRLRLFHVDPPIPGGNLLGIYTRREEDRTRAGDERATKGSTPGCRVATKRAGHTRIQQHPVTCVYTSTRLSHIISPCSNKQNCPEARGPLCSCFAHSGLLERQR